jgi:putative Holliday junction resolvase
VRLLALDVGERRIGLASGVAEIGTALPAGFIRRSKLGADIQAVLDAAGQRQSDAIVVGVPYRPGGDESTQTRYVQGFIRALRRESQLPVLEVDEVFTSFEAEGLLREAGHEPSRDRGSIDESAAVLILRRFLETGTDPNGT